MKFSFYCISAKNFKVCFVKDCSQDCQHCRENIAGLSRLKVLLVMIELHPELKNRMYDNNHSTGD